MKKLIIKSCLDCDYHVDYDDPPGFCRYSGEYFYIPDEERQKPGPDFIWENCKLEDYPDYNTRFHNWLKEHFPRIQKEWDIYQETKDGN